MDLYLGEKNGHVTFEGLLLAHGHAEWLEAIAAAEVEFEVSLTWQKEGGSAEGRGVAFRKERIKLRKAQPKLGHGLSYRFVKDRYGWRIFVTVTKNHIRLQPDFSHGAMGLDVNAQHVNCTRIGPDGAFISSRDRPMVTVGKSSGQRLGLIHNAAHELIAQAQLLGVPIIIEKLGFTAKRRRLREFGCVATARRLSAFCYRNFATVLKADARLHGVCVVERR